MKKKSQPRLKTIARRLLDLFGVDGKHWIQYDLAEDEDGNHVDPKDKEAGSWCLLGGLEKTGLPAAPLRHYIRSETEHASIPDFNDNTDWPTIRAFLMKLAHPYQPKEKSRGR